jgi:3-hydroxyisobutyrate dehydrogenase
MTTGILGLGNMGGRIARRIRAAGHEIRGFDVDATRVADAGVDGAADAAEVIAGADVLLLSLPDSQVIESVVYGAGGVLEHVRPGRFVVDLSTAAPASSVKIHAALRDRGVEFVDAGISGGPAAAEAGTLTVMAGGSPDALEAVRPVLESFSSRIYSMGAAGTGHATKLLNNFLNGIALAATAEVAVAAEKAGLDLRRVLDVLNHSTGFNYATLHRFPRIVEGDYVEGGLTSELMAKDIRLYLDLVGSLGVKTFTGDACLEAFEFATASGYGHQVSNRIVDAFGDLAGGVRVAHAERGGAA